MNKEIIIVFVGTSIANKEKLAAIGRNTILSKGTPERRMSTVRSWLRWLLKNWNPNNL